MTGGYYIAQWPRGKKVAHPLHDDPLSWDLFPAGVQPLLQQV